MRRIERAATAERAAERLADATPGTTVVARAGDSDPVLAMQDALREFKADEVIIVTTPDDDAGWLEERANEIGEVGGNIPFSRAQLGSDGSVTLEPRAHASRRLSFSIRSAPITFRTRGAG